MSRGRRYLPTLPAHKGYTWVDVEDLEEPTADCQACGKTEIRYIHTLTHPEHPSIEVGCDCAEHLTADYVNPAAREKDLRNKASRKQREKKKYPGYYGRNWTPLPTGLIGGRVELDNGDGFLRVKKLLHKWVVDHITRSGPTKSAFIFAKSFPDAANQAVDLYLCGL